MVSQYLTEDSSWEALVGNMASTRQRLEREQLPTAKTMYLDCTVTGEGAIRAALPGVEHVMEDPFHVMRRITDFIPDDVVEKRECRRCLLQSRCSVPLQPNALLHGAPTGEAAMHAFAVVVAIPIGGRLFWDLCTTAITHISAQAMQQPHLAHLSHASGMTRVA